MCQEFIKAGKEDKYKKMIAEVVEFEQLIDQPGEIEHLEAKELYIKAGKAALILATEYDESTPVGKNQPDGLNLIELDLSILPISLDVIENISEPIRAVRVA